MILKSKYGDIKLPKDGCLDCIAAEKLDLCMMCVVKKELAKAAKPAIKERNAKLLEEFKAKRKVKSI